MNYALSIILGSVLICTVGVASEQDRTGSGGQANTGVEAETTAGAPAGLHLKIVPNGFQLNWTLSPHDPGTVTGYEIVRADRFTGPFDIVAMVKKGTSQYIDKTAAPETIYYYKVRAVAGKAYSTFSNMVPGER